MASRLVKCYGYCNEKHPQDQMIKFQNANHCSACYEKKAKEVKDREMLYNLLKEVFNLNFPTGLMLRQIKEYKTDRGYTYKNIAFTVDYMIKQKGIQLQTKFGIALVPHYYEEMIDYYKDLQERRSKTVVTERKVRRITIKPKPLKNDYRERKMINMEALLNDNNY